MGRDKWAYRSIISAAIEVILCYLFAVLGREAGVLVLVAFVLGVAIFFMVLTSLVTESRRGNLIALAALLIVVITFFCVIRFGIYFGV